MAATKKDDKRQTIHMPFGVHDQLRTLAFNERTSQQELLRQGVDMLFAARGVSSWDQCAKADQKQPEVE